MTSRLHKWVEALPEDGRYTFSRPEVQAIAHASDAAIKMALYRLKRNGAVVSPRRDFFVVVPREYRSAGCPPASWFIDDLMRHLERDYYVGLLTAAALHGAGHQQPMAFQVIVDAAERGIEVGRVRIEFHVSNLVAAAETQRVQTETGTMTVSSPETTVFDIVRFPAACGSWSNVATVLAELAEKLDVDRLVEGVARVARSDVQRLGWLLDFLHETELANALAATLNDKRLHPTPLVTTRARGNAALDPRWRVLVNDDLEPDL
ncbi:MAG: type IV toxin-antitoxin system AbiEi family antitoxin [Myxococcales bacterium]|nr:type IV toxin-antitoxin system AbiEi family antitoxin [Myxococcales bacterium]